MPNNQDYDYNHREYVKDQLKFYELCEDGEDWFGDEPLIPRLIWHGMQPPEDLKKCQTDWDIVRVILEDPRVARQWTCLYQDNEDFFVLIRYDRLLARAKELGIAPTGGAQ